MKTSLLFFILFIFSLSPAFAAEKMYPKKGVVTMIDLGAKSCIPCKMMAPILEKLEKEYTGIADIIFIDVWENKSMAPLYQVKTIPTQIFYNKNGEEIERHVGFLEEEIIREKIEKLLQE